MDLGNSFEIIVHYLLFGGMIDLGHQDEFSMVNALLCMVKY